MKHITLLLGLLAIQTLVFAQKGIHLGVQAYPGASWMLNKQDRTVSDDQFKYKYTWSMGVGVKGGYGFNDHIALHLGLLYFTQGQVHQYKNSKSDTITNNLRLYYLKVPVLFRWTTDANRKYVFAAEAGPQASFFLSNNEWNNDKRYYPESPQGVTLTNMPSRRTTFTPFNIGLAAAVGVDVKLRYNLKMNAMIRGDFDFTDAEDKSRKFDVTKDGTTTREDYYYSSYTRPYYSKERKATNNATLSLGIGFTYIFIPRFHY
ncbi:MAG: PorT family protein [Bacteroidia bacterium]|nr:PorT family protein [Bacteroidia bacterium]